MGGNTTCSSLEYGGGIAIAHFNRWTDSLSFIRTDNVHTLLVRRRQLDGCTDNLYSYLPLLIPVALSRNTFIECTAPYSSNMARSWASSMDFGTWPTNILILSGSGSSRRNGASVSMRKHDSPSTTIRLRFVLQVLLLLLLMTFALLLLLLLQRLATTALFLFSNDVLLLLLWMGLFGRLLVVLLLSLIPNALQKTREW